VNSHQGTGTTRYLLDGASVLEELDAANANRTKYLNNPQQIDEVLAYQRGSTTEYLLTDALGSVYASTAAAGAIVHRYDFGVYGKRTDLGGSAPAVDVGYTGRRHDLNGLIQNGRRERNPLLGSWMSADPIGMVGGPNFYAYVGGNPVMFTDPTGMIRDSISAKFAIALAMAVRFGGQHIQEAAHYFDLLVGRDGAGRLLETTITNVHQGVNAFAGNCEAVSRSLGDVWTQAGAKVGAPSLGSKRSPAFPLPPYC